MMLERCQDCSLFIDSRAVDDEVLVAYGGLSCEDYLGHALMASWIALVEDVVTHFTGTGRRSRDQERSVRIDLSAPLSWSHFLCISAMICTFLLTDYHFKFTLVLSIRIITAYDNYALENLIVLRTSPQYPRLSSVASRLFECPPS